MTGTSLEEPMGTRGRVVKFAHSLWLNTYYISPLKCATLMPRQYLGEVYQKTAAFSLLVAHWHLIAPCHNKCHSLHSSTVKYHRAYI